MGSYSDESMYDAAREMAKNLALKQMSKGKDREGYILTVQNHYTTISTESKSENVFFPFASTEFWYDFGIEFGAPIKFDIPEEFTEISCIKGIDAKVMVCVIHKSDRENIGYYYGDNVVDRETFIEPSAVLTYEWQHQDNKHITYSSTLGVLLNLRGLPEDINFRYLTT